VEAFLLFAYERLNRIDEVIDVRLHPTCVVRPRLQSTGAPLQAPIRGEHQHRNFEPELVQSLNQFDSVSIRQVKVDDGKVHPALEVIQDPVRVCKRPRLDALDAYPPLEQKCKATAKQCFVFNEEDPLHFHEPLATRCTPRLPRTFLLCRRLVLGSPGRVLGCIDVAVASTQASRR
jgi:hypothetical protein